MMYANSIMSCMSSALSEPDGLGLGTLGFNPAVAERMAREAGFTSFTALDYRRVERSEEHTSELQSQFHLVCRLLLEKKNESRLSALTVDPSAVIVSILSSVSADALWQVVNTIIVDDEMYTVVVHAIKQPLFQDASHP